VDVADPSRHMCAAELGFGNVVLVRMLLNTRLGDLKVVFRAAAIMDQEAVALWKSVLQRLNSTAITSITGRGLNVSVATLELTDDVNKLATKGSLSIPTWRVIIQQMQVRPKFPVASSRPQRGEQV